MTRRRRSGRPGWARAQEALAETFEAVAQGSRVEVGRVRWLGRGLFREGWVGPVTLDPDPGGWSGEWVALLPLPDEPADRALVRAEARTLAWLATQPLAVRVPRAVPPVGDVLVCGWVPGVPLERKSPHTIGPLAEVARAVHALAPPDFLPGPATRRAHAAEEVERLARFEDPVIRDARAWATAHLPPDTPASLLHGDLLPQNVLFHFELPPAALDWACARRGDPAWDLAIVTRGTRAPFGEPDGLERLVRAVDPGGERITVAHVRIHELGLLASWVEDDRPDAEQSLSQLRNLARRAMAGA